MKAASNKASRPSALRNCWVLATLLLAVPAWAGIPQWGDRHPRPAETTAGQLEPGQWTWTTPEPIRGSLKVIISLDAQRAYVYRNGQLIAVSTISSGKPGHETPTGVYPILQKDKYHHSSLYDNAPMPYQLRLTWDGVALHAGGLPGYPESHGCVHLPTEFARRLFEASRLGTVVVVSDRDIPVTDAGTYTLAMKELGLVEPAQAAAEVADNAPPDAGSAQHAEDKTIGFLPIRR